MGLARVGEEPPPRERALCASTLSWPNTKEPAARTKRRILRVAQDFDSFLKGKNNPLIISLHGLGGTQDTMVRESLRSVQLAEEGGYILVTPMGYN